MLDRVALRGFTGLTPKQKVALLAPPFLLATTYAVFNLLVGLLGPKAGYFGGFLFYWLVWCLAFPWWLLGADGLWALFRGVSDGSRRPTWGGWLALLIPVALAYATKLPQVLPRATLGIVVASVALACVNATAEEVLWRGVYLTLFPGRLSAGYFYQAFWFGLWHLSPQSINPNTLPGGTFSLVAFAMALGLAWGAVAWQTRSLRWSFVAHILLNSAGLGALVYMG